MTGNGKKRRTAKIRIREYYERGLTPEEISVEVHLSVYTVKQYLTEMGLKDYQQREKRTMKEYKESCITFAEIERFRHEHPPGSRIRVIIDGVPGEAMITGHYPFLCQTLEGIYPWAVVVSWNRGRRKNE